MLSIFSWACWPAVCHLPKLMLMEARLFPVGLLLKTLLQTLVLRWPACQSPSCELRSGVGGWYGRDLPSRQSQSDIQSGWAYSHAHSHCYPCRQLTLLDVLSFVIRVGVWPYLIRISICIFLQTNEACTISHGTDLCISLFGEYLSKILPILLFSCCLVKKKNSCSRYLSFVGYMWASTSSLWFVFSLIFKKILLTYSWYTVLIVSAIEQSEAIIQVHTFTPFKGYPHIGYYRILSWVPCSSVGPYYLFIYSGVCLSAPTFRFISPPLPPTTPVTVSLFSTSVILILFCK